MADDDSKIEAVIDLDTTAAMEQVLGFKEAVLSIGDSEGPQALLDGLMKVGGYVGILAVTVYAIKTAFDDVFDAEKIQAINNQFEILTKNAGLVGDTLKEGMINAAGGMVGETELIEAANKAVVEMGGSAKQLPEIMELARKATAVMGGDVMQNFEGITRAVATGNERELKHMGIIIDVNAAYKKYADSIGVSVGELSKAGQSQAVLNAVLEKGQTAFQGISAETMKVTTLWTKLKVLMGEIGETFKIVFGEGTSSLFQNLFGEMNRLAGATNLFLKDKLGHGAEQASAHLARVSNNIKELETDLATLEKAKGITHDAGMIADYNLKIEATKKRIADYKGQIDAATASVEKLAQAKKSEAGPAKAAGGDASMVDKKKVTEDEAKFQSQMLKLKEDRIKKEMALSHSAEAYDDLVARQRLVIEQQTATKIAEIKNGAFGNERQKAALMAAERRSMAEKLTELDQQAAEKKAQLINKEISLADNEDKFEALIEERKSLRQKKGLAEALQTKQKFEAQEKVLLARKDMTEVQREAAKKKLEKQRDNAVLQQTRQLNQELLALDDQSEKEREAVMNRWVEHANGAAEGFYRGFANASRRAGADLTNFSAQGQAVFGMMGNSLTSAFVQMGKGSEKGSDVIKKAALGMVAQICQYYGSMLLLTSIWPPNPLGLAAGAGLLVLSGVVSSMAGGSAGGGSGGGGVSGSPASFTSTGQGMMGGVPSSLAQSNSVADNQVTPNSVHLTVQGSIFDSDATSVRIAQLVRQSSDATGFSIARVGGGV
jgi:hypothetical protein